MGARKPKSAVVSSAGFLAEVWLTIERAAVEWGLTPEDLHFLGTEEARLLAQPIGLAVAEIVMEGRFRAEGLFPVTVDYSLPLKTMIQNSGLDRVDFQITADRFSITGFGRTFSVLDLVQFTEELELHQLGNELSVIGKRAATLQEGLAFAAKYPDEQRRERVIIPGSIWVDGNKSQIVTFLDVVADEREIRTSSFFPMWARNYRILAANL